MIASPQGFIAAVLLLAGGIPALAARVGGRLFAVLPPVVVAYMLAMVSAVAGLWADTPEIAAARAGLIDTLLPALVFLLVVPCDLRAVARVGPRLLAAFAAATISILAGFVVAWLVWRPWLPADGWQVLAAVAAGWVGGTANLVAVAGSLGASADALGLAVVTDSLCYSCWVLALFSSAGLAGAFNRWSEAPAAGVAPGLAPPSAAQGSGSAPLRPVDLVVWLGLGLAVGAAAAAVAARLPSDGVLSSSSWTILLATLAGAVAAQTPLRRIPGASELAPALLGVVVVAMGTQATLRGLLAAPVFIAVGFTVLACHALGMAVAARLLRLDLASCSVASLANIGGVASAPLMAAVHAPALAPAAVLLALLGYLIGVPAGLAIAAVLPRLPAGLALPALVIGVGQVLATAPAGADEPPDRRSADSWVARCVAADRVLVDAAGVAAANARMLASERSVRDLAKLPDVMQRPAVAALVEHASRLPPGPLVHADGTVVTDADRARWLAALALDGVPAETAPRFGLVVRRAAVRRLPTGDRVLADAAAADIDQLQETALFPGTPVVAIHRSADGHWEFVLAPTYAGWVAVTAIAHGTREEVLDYASRSRRVVTGGRVATAYTPEAPAVSQLVLDMGSAIPELADWPRHEPVNGQLPWAGHVVELPTRAADGSLVLSPALVPFAADTHRGPLPATRGHVIRQACKFLGDRYGWGHDRESRDCSGLVTEVYRSLGLLLPRNTADQAVCPALDRTPLDAGLGREARLAAIARLQPGDLIYAPRHVMIVLGHDPDTWVIHATHGGRSGPLVNGIVIVPLAEVTADGGGPIVDSATVLVRVLPAG